MTSLNIPTVKVEHQDGSSVIDLNKIKPEVDSVAPSPSALSDDDVYEDTGDLDFSAAQNVYLMRMPKWLWENWSKIDDDEQIQLGTVRVEDLGEDQNGDHRQKLTMLLSPSVKYNKGVPKEYNMNITNAKSTNMYIFSEKDLPSYKVKGRPKRANVSGDGDVKVEAEGHKKPEGNKRWHPYYRKAIPKQTSLAGIVKHEINCLPLENEEYRRVMAEKATQAAKPKKQTKFLKALGSNPTNLLAPGTLGSSGDFGGFIRTGAPQRAKAQEQKAARIPQNELLDLIYGCFKRYNYWSMKALKAELNQPEAYLKSTLEMIAELVKSGRFAMTWTLKPENKIDQYAAAEGVEEQAPDAGYDATADLFDGNDDGGGGGVSGDDDDEDDVKMEDVLPL